MSVLGGAGSACSHAVNQLVTTGYEVSVINNLLTGHIESLHEKAHSYRKIYTYI
ncbi:hypothetical protein IEQ_04886 [Bacillus cereus BAG6X1-2]|nr:hypothetical protein IEQ_04886 [Bacillus cereus BAG6X1-2]